MWKPIDTAPKDGTYVLVKCRGHYSDRKSFVPGVAAFANNKWREVDDCLGDYDDDSQWAPELWMELPPTEDGAEYVNIYDK